MAKFNSRAKKNDEDTIKEEIQEKVETNIIENTDPVDPIIETNQDEEKQIIQPEEPKTDPVVTKKVTKKVKSSSLAEFLY